MKKIIVLSIVLLPAFAFAQFSSGQVFIGGTLSTNLQSTSVNDAQPNGTTNFSKNNSFSIQPMVGFFLNSKIAIGGGVNYNYSLQQYNYTMFNTNTGTNVNEFIKYKNSGLGINAFTRYYLPVSNSIYIALQGQVNFTRANETTVQNSGT